MILATDVVTEYGKYYRSEGQGVQDLQDKIFEKSVTESIFMRRVTEQTVLRKASAEISTVLQAFQKAFTPKGDTTFKPRPIQLYKLKIDVAEHPDDLEESWLGFLADTKLDRKTWPFVRWWIEKMVIPQSQEDWELNEIYHGVYVAPTANVANPAGANFDGIKKQINDGITAGDITPITTGAWSSTPKDFVTQVEAFFKEIPHKYRGLIKALNFSRDNTIKFRQGMRDKYNVNYNQATDLLTLMDYPGTIVKGLPSMDGSDKVWCTIPENMAAGIRGPQNEKIVEVENIDRQVKAYTDYWKGVGFWILEWVFTNDLDLGGASSS